MINELNLRLNNNFLLEFIYLLIETLNYPGSFFLINCKIKTIKIEKLREK